MSDFDDKAKQAARSLRQKVAESSMDIDSGLTRVKRARTTRNSLVASSLVVVLIAAILGTNGFKDSAPSVNENSPFLLASSLRPAANCDDLHAYFKDQAKDRFTQLINPTYRASGAEQDVSTAAQEPVAPANSEANNSTTDYSTTNVQEAGVDEPDTIKTDGKRIFSTANGKIYMFDVVDRKPVLRSTVDAPNVQNLLLSGDRLLAFGSETQWAIAYSTFSTGVNGKSQVLLYDVSSIATPKLISNLSYDGVAVDARMVGSQVRLVTKSDPRIAMPQVDYDNNGQVAPRSKESITQAIADAPLDAWLPQYKLIAGDGAELAAGPLTACENVAIPNKFAGLSTLTVSTFDMATELSVANAVAVVSSGNQVYATSNALYVAFTDWTVEAKASTTHLHKFLTDANGKTTYQASGEVEGTLLNQYAMSEYNNVLRVASTVSNEGSQGVVTTFKQTDASLERLGQVDGLGKEDNESVRAVRFIGDKGYVVTFRQTDPLYVIDLSNPSSPKVAGELKIPGYSGYLHPISNTLLLGVGQSGTDVATAETSRGSTGAGSDSATEIDPTDSVSIAPQVSTDVPIVAPQIPDGSVSSSIAPQASGVQFSLFDVSNPANPTRVATKTYASGNAMAEWDAKAFLYWPQRDLIVAPISLWDSADNFNGVVMLQVKNNTIEELGRINDESSSSGSSSSNSKTMESYDVAITRTLIIGDDLYALSAVSLQSINLDTMQKTAKVKL